MNFVAPLGSSEWDRAVGLVASAGLPTEDLTPGRQVFWGAWEGGLVGVIAWERVGDDALVRSFAVEASLRGQGLGSQLYQTLEAEARTSGILRLVLLTETAQGFFSRQGFGAVDRDCLSSEVKATAEFTGLCPVSAVCMAKALVSHARMTGCSTFSS